MQFILKGGLVPREGRFREDGRGGLVVEDLPGGMLFAAMAVRLVVVDDVEMGERAERAGYKVHTPLSANLELGVTGAPGHGGFR